MNRDYITITRRCQSNKTEIKDRTIGLPRCTVRDISQRIWIVIPDQSVYCGEHQADVQIERDRPENPMNRHFTGGQRRVPKGIARHDERAKASDVKKKQGG